ncbi:MAG: hypothetical protein JWP58_3778 [Hymenobacter sp.]|nr:hypothetical protein [Hymenobacter sp.]
MIGPQDTLKVTSGTKHTLFSQTVVAVAEPGFVAGRCKARSCFSIKRWPAFGSVSGCGPITCTAGSRSWSTGRFSTTRTARGVISHVQADFADKRDSLHLPRLLTGLQRRLQTHELRLRNLLADAGYANGPNYARLEAEQVTAWIPVFGQYKPDIEGFTYNRRTDAFTCPEGQALPFQKYDTNQDGGWHKIYCAPCRTCQQCPRKPLCAPRAKRKQINRTIYDAAYRRAWLRQQTRRGQRQRRVRQGTVEPVFGNLLHHYGLRRLNVRGHAGAHKTMLLTAVAYNLKKLLKHHTQQQVGAVVALPKPLLAANGRAGRRSRRPKALIQALAK